MAVRLLIDDPANYRSTAKSREAAIRLALSRCESLSLLCDNKTEGELLEHITTGHVSDPWEERGEAEASREDLERKLLRCFVLRHREQPNGARRGEALAGCPEEDTAVRLRIRRQVRDTDLTANDQGRAGVYDAFDDLVQAIPYELIGQARAIGASAEIDEVLVDGVYESDPRDEPSGMHLTAELSISFALAGGEGGAS